MKTNYQKIFLLASLFLSSCSKNFESAENVKDLTASKNLSPNTVPCPDGWHWDYNLGKCVENNSEISYVPLTLVTNSNNANETVGSMHNEGLNSIVNQFSLNFLPTDINISLKTKTFLFSKGKDSATARKAYFDALQQFGSNYDHQSLTNFANFLFSTGKISSTAKNYIITLENYINGIVGDSLLIPTQLQYNSYANNLKTQENNITNNSTLSQTDKSILLSAFSVARYSIVWHVNYSVDQLNGSVSTSLSSTSLINEQQLQQQQKTKPWYSWGSTLKSDIAGAVGGGIAGALGGAAVGGVGAGPGALIGACSGGIGNSAQDAVSQILNHFWP